MSTSSLKGIRFKNGKIMRNIKFNYQRNKCVKLVINLQNTITRLVINGF